MQFGVLEFSKMLFSCTLGHFFGIGVKMISMEGKILVIFIQGEQFGNFNHFYQSLAIVDQIIATFV